MEYSSIHTTYAYIHAFIDQVGFGVLGMYKEFEDKEDVETCNGIELGEEPVVSTLLLFT